MVKITKINNDLEIIANFYLESVSDLGGCPVKVRTDCGTENEVMAAMQCTLREDVSAHMFGSSPAIQRIEGSWSFLRKNKSDWWIESFLNLMEQDIIGNEPGNELQMDCLWFVLHSCCKMI